MGGLNPSSRSMARGNSHPGHLVNIYVIHDSFLLYSIQLHNFGIGLGHMCMLVDFRAAPQFLGLLRCLHYAVFSCVMSGVKCLLCLCPILTNEENTQTAAKVTTAVTACLCEPDQNIKCINKSTVSV